MKSADPQRAMIRFAFAAVLIGGAVFCTARHDGRTGSGPRTQHFAGWGGYDLPIHMQHPISKSEAETSRAYYVAEYDEAGRLAVVQKMLDGRRSFRHEYTYDATGMLVEARVTNDEGKTSILKRFADGRMVTER